MLDSPFKPVLTKADFVARYKAGEFGNASPTWNTIDAFLSYGQREFGSGPSVGTYHLRNRVAGGETHYNLHWSACVAQWIDQKDKTQWYASAMCPHDKNLIQGEVMLTERGLYLYYSPVVGLPMRDALKIRSESLYGITALNTLKRYLCPNSYDWMQELLDRYPGHVVEFTALSTKWGTLYPRFNTIYWEIRAY